MRADQVIFWLSRCGIVPEGDLEEEEQFEGETSSRENMEQPNHDVEPELEDEGGIELLPLVVDFPWGEAFQVPLSTRLTFVITDESVAVVYLTFFSTDYYSKDPKNVDDGIKEITMHLNVHQKIQESMRVLGVGCSTIAIAT